MKALFQMREAIDHYYKDHQRYPNDLRSLVAAGYLPRIPANPFDGTNWRIIPARRSVNKRGSAGIYDVKSMVKGTASDGTRYSDW